MYIRESPSLHELHEVQGLYYNVLLDCYRFRPQAKQRRSKEPILSMRQEVVAASAWLIARGITGME